MTYTPTSTATSTVTSTATSPATSTTPGTPTNTPTSTPTYTPEPDDGEEVDDDEGTSEPDVEQIGPQNTPGPIEGNGTPPTIVATVLAISTPTSKLPPPLVIVSTDTPFGTIPSPTATPPAPTAVSLGLTLTKLLSGLGDTQVIGEAIRASPVGNVVGRMVRRLLPELAPIPTAAPTTAPAEPPVNEVPKLVQPFQEQIPAPPPPIAPVWPLLLIMLLPLLLAILFVILLCMRNVTKSVVRFLLAQLVLLGSMLVILFIIFSSSPWLLEAASLQTFAVILIVLLLEEACLFFFVISQRCNKHYVLHQISVEDFDLWKDEFDKFRPELKNAGSKADFVFRNIDEPNDITVLSEVANQKKGRAFIRADETRVAFEHSSAGALQANLLEETDKASVCCKKDPRPTYVLGQIVVNDFKLWKKTFDELRLELNTAGSNGEFIFRNTADPNRITVLSEIDDLEKARAFVIADALPNAMQHSDAHGPVYVCLLEDTGTSSPQQ